MLRRGGRKYTPRLAFESAPLARQSAPAAGSARRHSKSVRCNDAAPIQAEDRWPGGVGGDDVPSTLAQNLTFRAKRRPFHQK